MKYLTKDHLLKIRSLETEDFKLTHSLADDYVAKLSSDVKLPVAWASFERAPYGPYKDYVRIIIIIPTDGKTDTTQATVYMPMAEYLALPEMDSPAAV